MKNTIAVTIIGLIPIFFIMSCNKTSVPLLGNWIQKSEFEGVTRSSAVAFVINDTAYVGTGFNSSEDEYYNDFWKYDATKNFWQRVADMPGTPRSSATAFAVNGKGYVGTGYDGLNALKDFWEYDPALNSWKQVADFQGVVRYGAVAFNVGQKGYVGTGYDGGNDLKDFWEYDPAKNTWTQIPSIGGAKRKNAVAFVLNNKAYVCTGIHNGIYQTDIWVFDPTLQSQGTFPWVEKTSLTNDTKYSIIREGASAFVMNSQAYIALGVESSYLKSVWHYIAANDTWEQLTDFEGTLRSDAVAFTLKNRGFVSLGRNGSLYFDDIWEFAPTEAENPND